MPSPGASTGRTSRHFSPQCANSRRAAVPFSLAARSGMEDRVYPHLRHPGHLIAPSGPWEERPRALVASGSGEKRSAPRRRLSMIDAFFQPGGGWSGTLVVPTTYEETLERALGRIGESFRIVE